MSDDSLQRRVQLRRQPPSKLERLEGRLAIARYIAKRVGIEVTTDAVGKWIKRRRDPLSVKRWGVARPRILADVQEVDAWCDRQWKTGRKSS
jgi:hypothetical protein